MIGPSNVQFHSINISSNGDGDFQLIVPSDLEPLSGGENFQLASRSRDRMVSVDVRRLIRDLNPIDWIEAELDQMGVEWIERQPLQSGGTIDLFGRYQHSGNVIHTVTKHDAGNVFWITATQQGTTETIDDQFPNYATVGFRLLEPKGPEPVEAKRVWAEPTPAPLSFEYPNSWAAIPLVQDRDLFCMELRSEYQGQATGQIRLEVHSAKGIDDPLSVVRSYAADMKTYAAHVSGGAILPIQPPTNYRRAWIYQPAIHHQGDAFESPVLLLESEQMIVLLALLGTSRESSAHWWAVNKFAFESIRDSLTIDSI